MKIKFAWMLVVPLFVHTGACTAETQSNIDLAEIFAQDQADRQVAYDDIDWNIISARDRDRQKQVLEILRQGNVQTSEDFRRAGMVFQHGETVEDARLAMSLAWVSATIDPDNEKAKWLTAAAWDRLLMYQDQPQWYGTQYRREGGEWRLFTLQEGVVTDEQRVELNVPTLNETNERLRRLNEEE